MWPPPPTAVITVRELPPPTSTSRNQREMKPKVSTPLEGRKRQRLHLELPGVSIGPHANSASVPAVFLAGEDGAQT